MAKLILSDFETSVKKQYNKIQLPNSDSGYPQHEHVLDGYNVTVTIEFKSSGDMTEFIDRKDLATTVNSILMNMLNEIEL